MENYKERLAAFQTAYGSIISSTKWAENDPDYIRVSEYIEVEFIPLPKDELINNEIAAIDKKIEAIKQDSIKKMNQLQQKKQELLALEHSV